MIYLDNAATTEIAPEVLDAMIPYLTNDFGNAGSVHSLGRKAKAAIDNARQQVANFMNCKPEQIVFTSGGTEANNLVFAGIEWYLRRIGKTHVVCSNAEHDSVLKSAKNLCIKDDFYLHQISVDERCVVQDDRLDDLLNRSSVGLTSIMYVNNETGSVNDVAGLCKTAHRNGSLFHTDCVQAAGSKVIDVQNIGCDFASISSHKSHGPKGTGALYVRDLELVKPIIHGGADQEFGVRGGTENVAGIVGFGMACDLSAKKINDELFTRRADDFYKHVQSSLERYGLGDVLHLNCHGCGKIMNVRFDNVDAETLILFLDERGIIASSGSACRAHESEPSHVLLAMGLTDEQARDSIRISFSADQSMEEILVAAEGVAECVAILSNQFSY